MRRTFLFAALAVFAFLFAADRAAAQGNWEDYWGQLQQRRDRWGNRYDDWRQQQEKYYEQRRAPSGQGGGDFRVELRDSAIPQGQYRIQLPFGLEARVNVQSPQQQPTPRPGWGPPLYAQVGQYTRQIGGNLRDIRYGVYQTRHEDLQRQVDEALSDLDRLQTQAYRRADESQLREQFSQFDQAWHRLAHSLAGRNYLDAGWIRREVEEASAYDNQLHQTLRIGAAPVYDRMRVAALSRQLADTTEHLLEDVEFEARDNPQAALLRRRVDRVRSLAADLEQAVAQGASFGDIVAEYEQFDQAWHRLMQVARQTPEVSDHLWRMGQRVAAIDRELHRELQVESPVQFDPGRLRNLAESVSQQAEHLIEDLRYGAGERNYEVVREAEMFASAARRLRQSISDFDQDAVAAADRAERYWNSFYDRLRDLDGRQWEHAKEMASTLEQDLERLLEMVRQGA